MLKRYPLALALLLAGLVFVVDLMLPLGVASAVPYTFAVLLALADRRAWAGPAVAGLCGVLTLAKMGIVPDRGTTEEWKVIANRGLALFAVCMTTLLGVLRRRAEERVKGQQAQLAHVGRLSLLGQVAAGLAHELNQPLAAVSLRAEVAARRAVVGEPVTAELVQALTDIAAQAGRAGEIVKGVRRLAKHHPPGTDRVSLDDAVSSAVALLDWQARRVGATVRVLPGGTPAATLADRVQVEQVLVNLIQNALDAVASEPDNNRTVTVAVTAGANDVAVRVTDTGRGGFDSARLFEPFYTTKAGGLGLGLAISRGIAEAHGGRLEAAAVPGGGTAFTLTLPRHKETDG